MTTKRAKELALEYQSLMDAADGEENAECYGAAERLRNEATDIYNRLWKENFRDINKLAMTPTPETPRLNMVRREIILRRAHALWIAQCPTRSPLWAFVSDVTDTGSTWACEICKELGWNPHAQAKDPLPR